MTDPQTIIKEIRDLAADPLGAIMFCEWKTKQGSIRWHGGCIQVRRDGEKYFSFGMEPDEFFRIANSPSR